MNDIKFNIKNAISDFNKKNPTDAALELFSALGYKNRIENHLVNKNFDEFQDFFAKDNPSFRKDKAKTEDWTHIDMLFQITKENIKTENQLFEINQVDNTVIESYIFFVIELKNSDYNRGSLAAITREINKLFRMPAMILFKYGSKLTFSIISRRINERDENKDVLKKVTLIKDIDIENTHRAHIEILFDLSLQQIRNIYNVTNFIELHNAWQKILDTKELNKRFYLEIANWYFWALDNVEFPKGAGDEKEVRNATSLIRLLTRLIFVWFLKEKHLVPDELFDLKFLDSVLNYKDKTGSTYYKAILQNLFFATLNTAMKKDDPKSRIFIDDAKSKGFFSDGYLQSGYFRYKRFIKKADLLIEKFSSIPFLNGGLFECLDKRIEEQEIRIDCFSDNSRNEDKLKVPDDLFFGIEKKVDLNKIYDTKNKEYKTRGLINILNSYKFTVAENTPIEEEIALDPELLGRVFENLLASYNPETGTTARKATGSFYTPREIVNYMVDESIIEYLQGKLESAQTGMSMLPNQEVNINQKVEQTFLSVTESGNQNTNQNTQTGMSMLPNQEVNTNQKVEQTFLSVTESGNQNTNQNTQTGMSMLPNVNTNQKVEQTFLSVNHYKENQSNRLIIKKRNLPHWTYDGSYYFITFRVLNDDSLNEIEQKITFEHILEGNNKFYHLVALVIMPDHVHIILKPNNDYNLSRIMKGIKGVTAHLINKKFGKTGNVWQPESFDRIIRNDKELFEKVNYMFNNPYKKEICKFPDAYNFWFINDNYDFYLENEVEQTFLSVNESGNTNQNGNTQTGMSMLPNQKTQTGMSMLPNVNTNQKVEQTFLSVNESGNTNQNGNTQTGMSMLPNQKTQTGMSMLPNVNTNQKVEQTFLSVNESGNTNQNGNTQTGMSMLPNQKTQTGMSMLPNVNINQKVEQTFLSVTESGNTNQNGNTQTGMSMLPNQKTQTGMSMLPLNERLRQLLSYTDEPHLFNDVETNIIINAIDNLKILDPACGSGAFPMGVLHKLVHILHKIDPDNHIWKQKLIDKTPTEIRVETKNALANKPLDYIRKLGLIESCIYGVDIQPIAIQISKLRFFISLIVEQKIDDSKENRDIKPLPNLETKFVAANTLIALEKPNDTLAGEVKVIKEAEELLLKIRKDIFYVNSSSKKKDLAKKEKEARKNLKNLLESNGGFGHATAEQIAEWDPFNQNASSGWFDPEFMFGIKNGFDIVIGNPPYIDSETMVNSGLDFLRILLSKNLKYTRGNWDIYIAFFEISFNIANKNGLVCFVTPDKWISKPFGYELRKNLILNINKITETGRKAFETVNVDSLVTIISKNHKEELIINKISENKSFYEHTKILKDKLSDPYNFDWLLSDYISLIKKIGFNEKSILNFAICENACATSDAYKLKELIENINENEFDSKIHKKIVNTGTIGKYYSKWGKVKMTYLGDKYLHPVVKIINFSDKFKNTYYSKAIKQKIIIKGITLLHSFIDINGDYVPGKTTLIITSNNINNLKFIFCLINSNLAIFYLKEMYKSNSYNQGINFTKDMLNSFPIPKISEEAQRPFIEKVDQILSAKERGEDTGGLEREIDAMVYKLYELTYDEVKIVEPEFKLTDEEYNNYKIME